MQKKIHDDLLLSSFHCKADFFPPPSDPFPSCDSIMGHIPCRGWCIARFSRVYICQFSSNGEMETCIYLLNIFYMVQSVFMFLWSSPFEPNRKKNMSEVLGKKTHFFSSWHKLCSFWKHFILKSLLIKVQTNIAFRFGFWITTL